ncbi:uncharacterized protein [Dysidea avara]|uniref:uncharacterized protein n=1 Tax=Dysidea avara TaxID=196820 RepID=UPI0033347053
MVEEEPSGANSRFAVDSCVICRQNFEKDKAITVTEKGMMSLISFSKKRGHSMLYAHLTECISSTPIGKVLVHKHCRRDYTNQRRATCSRNIEEDQLPQAKRLRSSMSSFNWKENCMLCGKNIKFDARHPERSKIHNVTTLTMHDNLLECCDKRGDEWASEVQKRLHGCFDLVAAEAIYHSNCYSRFLLNKGNTLSTSSVLGRTKDREMLYWFQLLCHWLESDADAELYTLTELHAKMSEFSDGSDVYTLKWLKQKLHEHYEDFIFFADVEGRGTVLCFRNMASYIINDKWYSEKKENTEEEAERIVSAAAKIIRAEIREINYDTTSYPTNEDVADVNKGREWIPLHLQTFLKIVIQSELKQNSIGHSIVQSARPRSVITPTLFGIGVEMDHVFGSRWLVNELSRLGFSITYDEVNRYKQSVIQSESLDNLLAEYLPGAFTQWVADNVDRNVASLDGNGSLYGMGIIAVSTPKDNVPLITKSRVISRQQRVKVNELVRDKGIPILQYVIPHKQGLASVLYKSIIELQVPYTLPSELYSNLLWHSGWTFSNTTRLRANWSGFMQNAFSDCHVSSCKSEVLLLPIIDLSPSDDNCMYSTLIYIEDQAERLNIPTPCVTFDQPLWLKAVEMIQAKSLNMVCRLGGFHTMMSFMGSIGAMMKGSGLEEALETVYGPNAVSHMISGKSVSRALRGHFLVEAALVNKLMLVVLPYQEELVEHNEGEDTNDCEAYDDDPISDKMDVIEDKLSVDDVKNIYDLYEGIQLQSIAIADIAESKELLKLEGCLLKYKLFLAEKSRTAKLWLQYIEYVETLKLFVLAERTGNWNLHLIATEQMLNLFAATGHINYAKSSRLYLQLMRELPTDHPWLYCCFIEQGFHTVRRSDRYWAGLWTDLIIEQVMMRSIKSRGGLTRGRGVTESVHLQWIYSMHKCAGIHDAMTTATNLKHRTSEQHIEFGTSRSKRDYEDLRKIQSWFNQYEPFDPNQPKLCSLSSGLTASDDDGVNCDQTEQVGAKIHKKLDNMSIIDASIKRSDQVRSLDHLQPGIQVDKKKVTINPMLLFSRLIAVVQREEDMAQFFNYELTTIPTSLFKDNYLRKTDKSQLSRGLKNSVEPSALNIQAKYVLDGGALIHKLKWIKKGTYQDIVKQYVSYVRAKYGNCCIVFDGYKQGPSIKDHEHERRVKKACADIQLIESMEANVNQETFLSNEGNKAQFISLLSCYLKSDAQAVHNSPGDADTMIAACALQMAMEGKEVNVVADDTDVLILLMHHWTDAMADVYFLSETKKSQKKTLQVWRIRDLISKAGNIVTSQLLFIHAWTGCDTTSATFGQGKTNLVKKIQVCKEVQQIALLMSASSATPDEVGKAGVRLFVILFGGKDGDSLNSLRHVKFLEMVSASKVVDPQKLPPTERAAYFHSLRVPLQVMLWKMLTHEECQYNPEEWGWRLDGTRLNPVMTDLPAAPETLLKFVRCKCKPSSRNPCGTNACSCRKNGLKCVTACGDCRGVNCKNTDDIILELEEENFDLEDESTML